MKWKHGKGGEEYRCGRCEIIFNSKDNLNRHMKRKHDDVADDFADENSAWYVGSDGKSNW